MSIFYDVTIQLKGIGKLYYDIDGKAFLYDSSKKEFKDITIYSPDQFKPNVRSNYGNKQFGDKEKTKEEQPSLDNVLIYSVKVGERMTNGKSIPILRYGFINEKGFAITHATYDRVEAFINGRATVFLDRQWCQINLFGYPILNDKAFTKAEFVFDTKSFMHKTNEFCFCCTDGKYGLINKFQHLCIPCEYDRISLKRDPSYCISYAELEKNGFKYVAFIEENSICNILNFAPTSICYKENFIIIEESFSKAGNNYIQKGLLNKGGFRILNSEYETIDIVSKCFPWNRSKLSVFAIVSKKNDKQLLLIQETEAKVIIDNCKEIQYGEGYDEATGGKVFYALTNNDTLRLLMFEDSEGNHQFVDEIIESISPSFNEEIDSVYFTFNGTFNGNANNYFAVVVGDKTKLFDFRGEEVMPLVIPSEYHVETDTFSEGLVGIYIIKQEKNELGETVEKRRYSYINSEGKILTDFHYRDVEKFENGQAEAYFLGGSDIIDCNGNIIEHKLDRLIESNWRDMIDDAFEGDPDAYWNID